MRLHWEEKRLRGSSTLPNAPQITSYEVSGDQHQDDQAICFKKIRADHQFLCLKAQIFKVWL
jgi:hypothetical protein